MYVSQGKVVVSFVQTIPPPGTDRSEPPGKINRGVCRCCRGPDGPKYSAAHSSGGAASTVIDERRHLIDLIIYRSAIVAYDREGIHANRLNINFDC